MFYGGFRTRWNTAKQVAGKALLLSTFGVLLTALLVGGFCYYALKIQFMESFLIGAVISSTDAASVFSILKAKKLSLKYKTSPMLELESGSNDPTAYMLTMIALEIMSSPIASENYLYMILKQFFLGGVFAVILAYIALYIYRNYNLESNGLDIIFFVGMILLSYALPSKLGGNGYLSTYVFGIIVGNKYINNKRVLINFFDGLTGLLQICLFFLLGLLAFPTQMPEILVVAIFITIFLTFIARPISIFIILKPLKCSLNQIILVSFAGIRGASAIVFAIMATVSPAYLKNDIFHIVFCIVLFSIAFQGTLLPFVAKKFDMIDEHEDILRTFTDYQEKNEIQLINLHISSNNPWKSLMVKEIMLPPEMLLVTIMRGEEIIVPNGDTIIDENDNIMIAAPGFQDCNNIELNEVKIDEEHEWNLKKIKSIKIHPNNLITIIKRDDEVIVPNGDTCIKCGDTLVLLKRSNNIKRQ